MSDACKTRLSGSRVARRRQDRHPGSITSVTRAGSQNLRFVRLKPNHHSGIYEFPPQMQVWLQAQERPGSP